MTGALCAGSFPTAAAGSMAPADSSQAFIDETLRIPGAKDGTLAGLTVAIKDLFDVCNMLHISPSVMQH